MRMAIGYQNCAGGHPYQWVRISYFNSLLLLNFRPQEKSAPRALIVMGNFCIYRGIILSTMSIAQKDHSTAKKSVFEQVRDTEEREHARVEEAKKVFENQMSEKKRLINEATLKRAEEKNEAARKEIEIFSSHELVAIAEKGREVAAQEIRLVEKAYDANAKNVIASLAKKALDSSTISS